MFEKNFRQRSAKEQRLILADNPSVALLRFHRQNGGSYLFCQRNMNPISYGGVNNPSLSLLSICLSDGFTIQGCCNRIIAIDFYEFISVHVSGV